MSADLQQALKTALPSGASYELRRVRTRSSEVHYDGNRFERIESADRLAETLRLQQGGKIATASGSKPGGSLDLLHQAVAAVNYGAPHLVPFVGVTEVPSLQISDDAELAAAQMIEIVGDFASDLRSLDPRLTVSAGMESALVEVDLLSSEGFTGSYAKTIWSLSGGFELVQGDDLLQLYNWRVAMGPHFDTLGIKKDLGNLLQLAKDVVDIESGAYPVIFAPGQVMLLINPVVSSLNALAVVRGLSPWADKLGEELLDPRFSLHDDGSAAGQWTSLPFDSEGSLTRRIALVEKGRLGEFLQDRKTAALLGSVSSGSSGGATPVPHHLMLSPGTKSLEQLIASVDKGLIIYDTMGAWSGNPYAGVVSGTISLGLKIEKGKIVGRVKDCMFTINAFEHFRQHLIDLSDTALADNVSMGHRFPYALLSDVVISTT